MGFSRQKYWSGLLFPFPKGSSRPGDQTWVFCVAGRFFTIWATREAHLRSQCWIIFFKKRLHNDITLNLKILTINSLQGFNSVQFSHSVVSDSLQPHGLQHTRPPYLSSTPRNYTNHVHWVGDAMQWSHPLSSLSPLAFHLSQHQDVFQSVSSHLVAKVLEFQLQHQSFQWIFRSHFI